MYPIPANATRIRYLESTGTQYIKTGLDLQSALSLSMSISLSKAVNTHSIIIGSYKNDSSVPHFQLWVNSGMQWGSVTSESVDSVSGYSPGTNVSVGVRYDISATTKANASDYEIYLFARNNDRGNILPFDGLRLYSLDVYTGSTLVRSYVPVRVGDTGELFDRVTGTYATRVGTFVCGPDTFSQGVVPTRMMAMGVRKKEALGSVAFSGNWDSCLTHSGGTNTVPTAFTFSAWVKTASTPTKGAFVKIGRKQTYPGGVVQIGSGVGVGFGSSRFDPTYTGSNLVALAESIAWKNSSAQSGIDAWHHWTFTVDNLSFVAYKDGLSVYTTTFSKLYRFDPCDISIGGCRGGNASGDSNRFLACNMTRSAMWGRALSASEVALDYADRKKAPTITNGLQHYWPMSNAKNYLKDEVGSATLTAGTGGVTISNDTPFA